MTKLSHAQLRILQDISINGSFRYRLLDDCTRGSYWRTGPVNCPSLVILHRLRMIEPHGINPGEVRVTDAGLAVLRELL